MDNLAHHPHSSEAANEPLAQLTGLLAQIEREHAKANIPYVAAQNNSLDKLRQLDAIALQPILQKISSHLNMIRATTEEHISFKDNPATTRWALKKLGLTCSPEFFQTLGHDHLVEIYTMDMVQTFRNFRFFEICGYSLLDLEIYPWHELYERSHLITNEIMKVAISVLQGERGFSQVEVPPHYMKEKFSSTQQLVHVEFKTIAPTWTADKQLAGFIVSQSARIILPNDKAGKVDFI